MPVCFIAGSVPAMSPKRLAKDAGDASAGTPAAKKRKGEISTCGCCGEDEKAMLSIVWCALPYL